MKKLLCSEKSYKWILFRSSNLTCFQKTVFKNPYTFIPCSSLKFSLIYRVLDPYFVVWSVYMIFRKILIKSKKLFFITIFLWISSIIKIINAVFYMIFSMVSCTDQISDQLSRWAVVRRPSIHKQLTTWSYSQEKTVRFWWNFVRSVTLVYLVNIHTLEVPNYIITCSLT